ncbi:hypothetical protein [Paenibacillus sp. Z6-24]
MQDRLEELMMGLNIGLVILIDDDFTIPDNIKVETIINDILLLKERNYQDFIARLKRDGMDSLANKISEAKESILKFYEEESFMQALKAKQVFFKLKDTDLTLFEQIKLTIEEKLSIEVNLKNVFLNFGIGVQNISNYKKIRGISENVSLRIYKYIPDIDDILNEIHMSLHSSEFCMFIVDKMISDDSQGGINFIKNDLLLAEKKPENLITIIYTTQPEEEKADTRVTEQDYFLFEVDKNIKDSENIIAKGLAICAFSILLERLSSLQTESIKAASSMALSKKDNIIYLAGMAHSEGITSYEAILNWFNIAAQYETQKNITSSTDNETYKFILGLTQFLEEELLTDNSSINIDDERDIQKLNTFELFDYSVNMMHRPPAPGDIFVLNEENFFILVGQDCDLMIRSKPIKRKAKYAELLKSNFIKKHNNEKVEKKINSIEFNYFKKAQEDDFGVLKVNLEGTDTGDFELLDLCVYNSDGQSKIALNSPLNPDIQRFLPKFWKEYYYQLQQKMNFHLKHFEILQSSNMDLEFFNNTDISIIDNISLASNQCEEIVFPLKRLCRIKAEFLDILLNSYWEHKSRIGINTIGLTRVVELPHVKVYVRFPGQEYEELINTDETKEIDFTCYLTRKNQRVSSKPLENVKLCLEIKKVNEKFSRLDCVTSESLIIEKNQFVHPSTDIRFNKITNANNKNNIERIDIEIPYIIRRGDEIRKHHKEKFTLEDIILKEELNKLTISKQNLTYIVEGKDKNNPLYSEGKPIGIEVKHLVKGIYIEGINCKIKIDKQGEVLVTDK